MNVLFHKENISNKFKRFKFVEMILTLQNKSIFSLTFKLIIIFFMYAAVHSDVFLFNYIL